ncbi:hypothetical protein MAC3UK_0044 [Bdellovibrio phage MAC3UK]|nr:hypothetical protein MAC3UK_0044 [Bdellovibrio phage MAC3UK]
MTVRGCYLPTASPLKPLHGLAAIDNGFCICPEGG